MELFSSRHPGFWGPITSTIDWCEHNYQFSHYIAEMANSLSNLATLFFAALGVYESVNNELPTRYALQFLGLAIVGIGSFAFHATLLYEAQLADELPMTLVASYSIFLLLDTKPGFSRISAPLLYGILAWNLAFDSSYIIYRIPLYFQAVFAILMLGVGYRCTSLLRGSPESLIPSATKNTILRLFWTGGLLFIFAFGIWNLDTSLCLQLTARKHDMGWPRAFLLEGHAWWHLMTAAATYLMMQGVTYVMLCVKDEHAKYTLRYVLGIPFVAQTWKVKSQ